MSIALHARMLEATAPEPLPVQIVSSIDRMIAVQMAAYPSDWSEDERREMAVWHLFGERAA